MMKSHNVKPTICLQNEGDIADETVSDLFIVKMNIWIQCMILMDNVYMILISRVLQSFVSYPVCIDK